MHDVCKPILFQQGGETTKCIHVGKGVLIRIDDHSDAVNLFEDWQSVPKKADPLRYRRFRSKMADQLASMFFPGPTVDTIVNPRGLQGPRIPAFVALRNNVLKSKHVPPSHSLFLKHLFFNLIACIYLLLGYLDILWVGKRLDEQQGIPKSVRFGNDEYPSIRKHVS